jgi:probable phosphoglycerate mutase
MPTQLTELILIRHGETEWNADGRLMNQLDSPLSSNGLRQADLLAARLARMPFDALYSSDLGRAVTTADCIARKCGKVATALPHLQERHTGVFAGHTWDELEQLYPQQLALFRSDDDYAPPGGESRSEFHRRTLDCLSRLAQDYGGGRIVAVAHGGTLGVVFRHTVGIPIGSPNPARVLNGSINVFEIREDAWRLRTWGDVSHLGE